MASHEPIQSEIRPQRKRWIIVAKWLIAALVAVGLFAAAWDAAGRWSVEYQRLESEIRQLDQRLATTNDQLEIQRLERSKQQLLARLPTLRNLHWDRIAIAALCYAIGMIPPGFVLRRLAIAFGYRPRVSTSIAAQLLGHAGKYVPGKAVVVVLRSAALVRDGVPIMIGTVSILMETFMMMSVGAALAGIIVVWLPVPRWITVAALGVSAVACVPTLPPVYRRIATVVTKVGKTEPLSQIGWGVVATGWFWSIISWLLIGASFTFLLSAIPSSEPLPPTARLYAISTAAITVAMVVGFASLLPGGAGVRELVLATVLAVVIGAAHGLLAAIAARMLFIAVEAVMSAAAWLWLKMDARAAP